MKITLKILGIILGILVLGGIIYSKTIYNYYDENQEMTHACYDTLHHDSKYPNSIFYNTHTGDQIRVCDRFTNCVTMKKVTKFIAPKTQVPDEVITPIVQDCMSEAVIKEGI